ncbi:MAG: ABC transporter ATP-binding protein [Planctomycetes bacterium]|nr:ABC transporter ATP-binding protein [Planctomycetota bacterium]
MIQKVAAPQLAAFDATFNVAGVRAIVDRVSLQFTAGACTAIIGPNGSGKTTLLRMLTGVRRPSSGRVELEGKNIQQYSRPEIACRIAYMPQNTWSDFDINVADAVAMGRFPHLGAWRSMTAADRDAVHAAMEQTGVAGLARRSIPTLSAGERQRVFLARSLAQGSPILIFDEPTSALDIGHQIELMDIIQKLRSEGKTILAAIHDLRLAWEHFPRAILLNSGRVTADGETHEVIGGEAARAAFGVRIDTSKELRFERR